MKNHKFDNSDMDGNYPTVDCKCGTEVILQSSLENKCPDCGQLFNGCGQELRSSRRSQIAQERGRDPGVGRPGDPR